MYLTICFIELAINLQIVSALGRSSSVIAPFLSFSWLALTLTESSKGAQQMEIISPPPPLRRGFRNQIPPACCLCSGQRVGYLLEVKAENTFTEAPRPSPCCIVEQKRSTNTTLMTCVCRGVVWVVQYVKVCVTVWIWINNLHEAEVNRCREENNLLDGFFFLFFSLCSIELSSTGTCYITLILIHMVLITAGYEALFSQIIFGETFFLMLLIHLLTLFLLSTDENPFALSPTVFFLSSSFDL